VNLYDYSTCRREGVMRKVQALAAAVSALLLTGAVACAAAAAEVVVPSTPAPLGAPPAAPPGPPPPAIATGAAVNIRPTGPPVVIQVGKGTLIRLPRPAATVFIANPDIADVKVQSPTLIYVNANKTKPGETVLYAVDDKNNVLVNKVILVELDLARLRQAYVQLMPAERISVSSVDQYVVLTGIVSSAGQAEKAHRLAVVFMEGQTAEPAPPAANTQTGGGTSVNVQTGGGASAAAAPPSSHVINHLVVATPSQINLRVRVAQVQMNVLKELGITLGKTSGRFQFQTTNPLKDVATGLPPAASALENSFSFLGSTNNISAVLDALTSNGFATNLAEPNLTALSGEKASFLVGGVIFIPGASVATGVSTGGVPSTVASGTEPVTFGVRLDFTATIIDADHINLKLRPEVSALNFANATTISGSTVPGKDETVAETTVELGSGETFALAGLLQHNTSDSVTKVPGLGDIPLVGALFRTSKFSHDDTELVIVVTPYIVKPIATSAATPLDGFVSPHDASRIMTGDNYRQQLPPPPRGPVQNGKGLIGPAGFRVD
jgi:pilus assembly protein CpaC